MNLLLFIIAAAAAAATPFHWEFDLKRCDRGYGGYNCYAPVNGNLSLIQTSTFGRTDYQMHPHVIAINVQSAERWHVVMQSRSRKQKVDSEFGMELHRFPEKGGEEIFFECKVVNGNVRVSSSPDIETELIDSYFDEHHLYCDFIVRSKKSTGKTIIDIISEKDKFGLKVSMDQKIQKCMDDYDTTKSVWSSDKEKYIATASSDFEKHECNLSQVKFDHSEAPKNGKVRSWEVYNQYSSTHINCPDDRYILHVSDSKGRKMKNARIDCRDGKYEIHNNVPSSGADEWTVERNETFNAFCHVEGAFLCPISMPCDGDNCPYVTFNNIVKEYQLDCEDTFNNILVASDREFAFKWNDYKAYCNWQHILAVQRDDDYSTYPPLRYQPFITTEAYCVKEDKFMHPNCARRNPLCNGKSCSIMKSDKPYEYTVTCTNPKYAFQEFSTKSNKWATREYKLHCNKDGEWKNSGQYTRCKDPADSTPPAEITEAKIRKIRANQRQIQAILSKESMGFRRAPSPSL